MACTKTFPASETLILTAEDGSRLIGILPLVKSRRYFLPAFVSPGDQFLDKSSLLVADDHASVSPDIIKKLTALGNWYLSELDQQSAQLLVSTRKCRISRSSSGRYLDLNPDPYRFLSPKNKSRIVKTISREKDNLSFTVNRGSPGKFLPQLLEIESQSLKKKELIQGFSDRRLLALFQNLESYCSQNILVNLLYYKNSPICYQYGFIYKDTYIGCATAYKSDFRYLFPGKVLTYLMLPEIARMGVSVLDFSRGDSGFKQDFSPFHYDQFTVFHSRNRFFLEWWNIVNKFRNLLENHPSLFNSVRKIKVRLAGFIPL